MPAYYNEIDPYAAQWLRNLIAAGHIAPGDVDERDIRDVPPDDLRGYDQVHMFAGIGGWSLALRQAGWEDGRPVWTGSCPCQPFSAAGAGAGFADERHLWPHFFHLISQRRPATVFGEQVASKDGLAWLDLVQSDLESAGYASAALDICAASLGAPHIRQRLFWVADANDREGGQRRDAHLLGGRANRAEQDGMGREPFWVADANDASQGGRRVFRPGEGDSASDRAARERPAGLGADSGLADSGQPGLPAREQPELCGAGRRGEGRAVEQRGGPPDLDDGGRPGPVNDFWRDADWLFCRDGKWRPIGSGLTALAARVPNRVGRLRAYGNAICVPVAASFVKVYMP